VELIYDDAAGHSLDATKVNALVTSMSAFTPQVITDASSQTLIAARDQAWVTL
jgi:hypothetical protein